MQGSPEGNEAFNSWGLKKLRHRRIYGYYILYHLRMGTANFGIVRRPKGGMPQERSRHTMRDGSRALKKKPGSKGVGARHHLTTATAENLYTSDIHTYTHQRQRDSGSERSLTRRHVSQALLGYYYP